MRISVCLECAGPPHLLLVTCVPVLMVNAISAASSSLVVLLSSGSVDGPLPALLPLPVVTFPMMALRLFPLPLPAAATSHPAARLRWLNVQAVAGVRLALLQGLTKGPDHSLVVVVLIVGALLLGPVVVTAAKTEEQRGEILTRSHLAETEKAPRERSVGVDARSNERTHQVLPHQAAFLCLW